jgi:hypothetical protein
MEKPNRFVGTPLALAATLGMGAVTIVLASSVGSGPRYLLPASIVAGILTWVAFVHTHAALYRLWMKFAHVLHTVAISVIFGACYLLIIPIFRAVLWFRDPLGLRRPPEESSWVARTAKSDALSMERMG